MQNEAGDLCNNYCIGIRPMTIIWGKMIHYGPKDGVHIFRQIKDTRTVMVILNSTAKDQQVKMDCFSDITAKYTIGRNVITLQSFEIINTINIPSKGEYILELSK